MWLCQTAVVFSSSARTLSRSRGMLSSVNISNQGRQPTFPAPSCDHAVRAREGPSCSSSKRGYSVCSGSRQSASCFWSRILQPAPQDPGRVAVAPLQTVLICPVPGKAPINPLPPIQHLANLSGQNLECEGLFQKGRFGVQNAPANHRIVGVAALEEHP